MVEHPGSMLPVLDHIITLCLFQVKNQLTDIGKAVPALALFCAPGGSVLLPAIMQVLDLRPSSIREHEGGPAKKP